MANDIQSKIQKQISWAMINSHHNGLIARASRSILACTTIHSIMGVVTRTLDELGLSGGGRLTYEDDCLSFQFGGGLSSAHCSVLSCSIDREEKIFSDENTLVFKEENFLLIMVFKGKFDPSMDLLKDNLAIFVDIVQGWIYRARARRLSEGSQRNQRLDVATKMNDIMLCLGRVSKHLVDSHYKVVESLNWELLSKFPYLSMDPDQEEMIIDIANSAMEKQKGLLEAQIRQNDDLQKIMKEAIAALMLVDETLETEFDADRLSTAQLF